MALDVQESYNQAQQKIQASQTYKDSKEKYDRLTKKTGDAFESAKAKTSAALGNAATSLNDARSQVQAFKKEAKNQFDQLLDISKLTGGKGANTAKYLKKTFIKVLRKIRPEIDNIVIEEIAKILGCDQQQVFVPQVFIIKVKSVDLRGMLKIDPTTKVGKVFYEKYPIQYQSTPFAMNKELYERIQSTQSYSADTGQFYLGASGQPLFDIQYADNHPITGVPGGWFIVTLLNRANNANKVIDFLRDYFKTIQIFDIVTVYASIMDALSGAISIEADFGIQQNGDATTLSLFIQRILGLCFDNAREIDVTGNSKLSELDDIDDSFFELSDVDLRRIEGKVADIQKGVVEFEDCDNVKLPVNSAQILDSLNEMLFIESEIDLDSAADNLANTLTSNPAWGGFQFNANIKAAVDLNFIKLIVDGLIRAILSPKILLPLIIMFKAITTNIADFIIDTIETYKDFFKKFKKMVIAIISKVGAIFVRELFEIIKKDLFNLIQSIVLDLAKEKADKRIIMISKLIQLLIVVISFIKDWRRCKSVVDELLKLLTIASTGFGLELPQALLLTTKLLDGYSASRAFIGTIQEMQKLGLPTGDLPDGSPNLELLSRFSQIKAQANEVAENMKLDATTEFGSVLPNGSVAPIRVSGKPV